ncbi:MAG TPA: hypothetical protein VH394_03535 [Thermoanaerobaculia bacterium]|nr:hypothetical protein [Thermoanaerobaculia bacterium]
MLDYLKKAFWAGPVLPGLGRLPVNALATLGFGILGVGHPAFWLLGAGLEAGYLALVATDSRFQRWVDRQRKAASTPEAATLRLDLVEQLAGEARRRFDEVDRKCARILEMAHDARAGDFEVESAKEALGRLSWIHLKLLVARQHLESLRRSTSSADLRRKIADLETELASSSEAPATLLSSREATLKILRQRLDNLERSERSLAQVNSDLDRVEAQIDLALESATARGGGAVVAADLELASQTLEGGLDFGESEAAVLALDEAYGAPARGRERG